MFKSGVWCNWQHNRFWSCFFWFESGYPNKDFRNDKLRQVVADFLFSTAFKFFTLVFPVMQEGLFEKIKEELVSNSDQSYAAFASALIPHLSRPMLGVRLPFLRTLARRLAKEEGRNPALVPWRMDTFEEVMLWGILLGYLDLPWSVRWKEICKFVPLMDNWSVCDSCCATYKVIRHHRADAFPDLLAYLYSIREYDQRFAVVMMMDHYLVDEYMDQVLAAWRHLQPSGYYVEMAVGWGLSVAALRYPTSTLQVLQDGNVALSVRLKACQKILESRRTPDSLRQQVRALREKLRIKNKMEP